MSLLLCACGGGAAGTGGVPTVTGNGFAPSSGPGDKAGYFPVGSGDRWQYDNSTGPKRRPSVLTIAVNGAKSVHGATATVLTVTDPTSASGGYDHYVDVSPGGVTELGNTSSTDKITPQIVPYVQLLFPVQLGPVSTVSAAHLPLGTDINGNAITLDMTQTIVNSSMESVDVPAGTYASALKQVSTVRGTVRDDGQSIAVSGIEMTWLVPGVGVVKDTSSSTTVTEAIVSDAEMRTALVSGQTHGFGPAATLVNLIPSGDLVMSAPQSPAIATDGSNFLIVTVQRLVSGGAQTQNWIGTLVAPDGSARSFNLTAPTPAPPPTSALRAVAGFDGTNYLIVYETDHTPALPTLEAVMISPTGGIVAAPHTVVLTVADGPADSRYEALAYAGVSGKYLLIYPQQVGSLSELYGVFLSPATAQPSGATFAIAPDTRQGGAAVASDGTNFLVAWDEQAAAPGLEAATVSGGSGTVSAPLRVFDESAACCADLAPAVSFDGSNYLVVYRDTRGEDGNLSNATISAARISAAGGLLDGSAIAPGIVVTATTGLALGSPTSAFLFGAHWIIWLGADGVLHGSRVSTGGAVPAAWTDGFALAPSGSITHPVLAARGTDGYLTWISGTAAPVSLTGLRVFGP